MSLKVIVFSLFLTLFCDGNKIINKLTCKLLENLEDCTLVNKFYENKKYIEYLQELNRIQNYNLDTLNTTNELLNAKANTVVIAKKEFSYKTNSEKLVKRQGKSIKVFRNIIGKTEKHSVRISWPLFSVDETTAIYFVSENCGYLCGSDKLYVYEKVDSEWSLKDTIILSIS